MKLNILKIGLVGIVSVLLFSCEESDEDLESDGNQSRWDCLSGECSQVINGSYSSQLDCNLDCGNDATNLLYTEGDGVTDYEGNFYPTVIINGREWMAENLRLRNAPPVNGPDLVYSNDFDNWTSSGNAFNGIRAYCYPDDNINNYEEYGVLYTWHAVRWVDLCPQGWHIPSIDEWWDMFESLDQNQYAYSTASDELRSIEGWITPGNNLSGMNIKSAGSTLGVVPLRPTFLGFRASFWTSTEMDSEHAEYIDIFIPNESYGIGVIKSFQTSGTRRKKWNAASCRCIKDQ